MENKKEKMENKKVRPLDESLNINDFFEKRGYELDKIPFPIWKWRLTDEEYAELKANLRNTFINDSNITDFHKKATIYIAEWWNKEYMPDECDIYEKFEKDLNLDARQTSIVEYASERGLKRFDIEPIKRFGKIDEFFTALMQGGLPVHALKESGNVANYRGFLLELISITDEGEFDYEDHAFVYDLESIKKLDKAFRDNDFIDINIIIMQDLRKNGLKSDYLELLEDVFGKEDVTGYFAKIKKLIIDNLEKPSTLKDLFPVEWNLTKTDDVVTLHYKITVPQKINIKGLPKSLQNLAAFELFFSDKKIEKYVKYPADKDGNVYFVNDFTTFEIIGELSDGTPLKIHAVGKGVTEETLHSAPDFSKPIMLKGNDSQWYIKKQRFIFEKTAVMLTGDAAFHFDGKETATPVTYYNSNARWIEKVEEHLVKILDRNNDELSLTDADEISGMYFTMPISPEKDYEIGNGIFAMDEKTFRDTFSEYSRSKEKERKELEEKKTYFAKKDLFYGNIPLFWKHREFILKEPQFYSMIAPSNFYATMYAKMGNPSITLGELLKIWENEEIFTPECSCSGQGKSFIYYFGGSPFGGLYSLKGICEKCYSTNPPYIKATILGLVKARAKYKPIEPVDSNPAIVNELVEACMRREL